MIIRSRIISSIGANTITQAVSILIQLVSVPVLLHLWGVEKYGFWILVSAMPIYFSFADAGYVSVAINRMAIFSAARQEDKAAVTFQSAIALTLAVTAIVGVLGVTGALLMPFEVVENWDARIALALLIVNALVSLSVGLIDAVFRSSGEYAFGIYLVNCIRIVEWLGLLAGVLIGGSMTAAALGMLAGRLLASLAVVCLAMRRHRRFRWGIARASLVEIKLMAKPALSFMGFPIGNAISLQGVSIMVGSIFGPAVLALFSTYRTVARILVQLTALLSKSLWPEISLLFGAGEIRRIIAIYQRSTIAIFFAAIVMSAVIYLAGPMLIKVWTHGAIGWAPSVLAIMLLSVIFGALWQTGMVVLSATNHHSGFAVVYVSACVGFVFMAWLATHHYGLNGVLVSMVLLDISLAVMAHRFTKRFFDRVKADG